MAALPRAVPGRAEELAPRRRGGRAGRWAAAVFLVGLAAHVPVLVEYRHDPLARSPVSDALSYDQWARRIDRAGLAAEPVFHQAPLFPVLLATVNRVAGESSPPWAALLLQALLTSAAAALLVPLGRRYLGSSAAGTVGAAVVILHGPFVFHDLKLLAVPPALLTIAAAMTALGLARARGSPALGFAAGVALGIAALARAEALLFAPLGALAAGRPPSRRFRASAAVAYLAGALVGVLPATLHNLHRGDLVLVASSGGENLFIGNERGAQGDYTPIHPRAGDLFSERVLASEIAERAAGKPLKPSQVSAYWRSRAVEEVLADPAGWLGVEARKLGRILDPGDPTDIYSFPLERKLYLPSLHLLPLPAWLLLLPGAVGVFLALRERPREAWPLVAFAGVQLAVLLLFFVNTRLRLPLLFTLAPFAGLAVVEAVAAWRARRSRPLVAASVLVAAAIGIVGSLLTRPTPRDFVRLAAVLSSEGSLDEALAVLAPVTAGPAPSPLALDEEGWVLQKKGNATAACERYRRALTLGLPPGRSTDTRTRLAMSLEKAGDLAGAAAEHDRAVEAADATAGTWYERGLFRVRRGDRAGGLEDLRRASSLDPSWDAPRRVIESLRP